MGAVSKEELRISKLCERFGKSNPKQYGNLHERMQYLIKVADKHQSEIPADVYAAIFDLRTEVRNYEPVNPPYGSRTGIVKGALDRAGRGRGVTAKNKRNCK